jgi:hypothetical protein
VYGLGEKGSEVRRHLILLALHDVYKEPGSALYQMLTLKNSNDSVLLFNIAVFPDLINF